MSLKKKKVLFVTYKLQDYRLPIFDIISNEIDLDICHSGEELLCEGKNYGEVIVGYKNIGSFTLYKSNFSILAKKYDAVVFMFYVQNLSMIKELYSINRETKIILWGIGVRASQGVRFDSPGLTNTARKLLIKKCDAVIFYSEYAKKRWIKKGITDEKLFVMPNTVKVKKIDYSSDKNRIIFAGTLNKSKKIFNLLTAYKSIFNYVSDAEIFHLDIVGGGEDYQDAITWIHENQLGDYINVHGPIYDEDALSKLYSNSIASISPGQAGLSVLTSFGYGVPFITNKNAITGGERLNILSGYNGIIYDENNDLSTILLDIHTDKEKYLTMGKNAYAYYWRERTPSIMAQGFIDAVNYVC